MMLSSLVFAAEMPQQAEPQNQITVLQNNELQQGSEQVNVQSGELDINLINKANEFIQAGICSENAVQNINAFAECLTQNGIQEDTVMEGGNQNHNVVELMEK